MRVFSRDVMDGSVGPRRTGGVLVGYPVVGQWREGRGMRDLKGPEFPARNG